MIRFMQQRIVMPQREGAVTTGNSRVYRPRGDEPEYPNGMGAQGELPDCPPRWFVNGVPYDLVGSPDDAFPPETVEGVEVYAHNVPPEYGGSRSACGVIVVWTREGV